MQLFYPSLPLCILRDCVKTQEQRLHRCPSAPSGEQSPVFPADCMPPLIAVRDPGAKGWLACVHQSIPCLQHVDCTTQLGGINKFTETVLNLTVHVADDKKWTLLIYPLIQPPALLFWASAFSYLFGEKRRIISLQGSCSKAADGPFSWLSILQKQWNCFRKERVLQCQQVHLHIVIFRGLLQSIYNQPFGFCNSLRKSTAH